MQHYSFLFDKYSNDLSIIKKRIRWISIFRLVCALFFCFSVIRYFEDLRLFWLVVSLSLIPIFLFLVKYAVTLDWQWRLVNNLVKINEEEINVLKGDPFLSYSNGSEFIDNTHSYSFDIDLFGDKSIYHLLNRTNTYLGRIFLKDYLLKDNNDKEWIISSQNAIKELSELVEWRQSFSSIGMEIKDSKEQFEKFKSWTLKENNTSGKTLRLIFLVFSVIPSVFLVTYFFQKVDIFYQLGLLFFLINLVITGRYIKRIKSNIISSDKIHLVILRYSKLLKKIGQKHFNSSRLQEIQKQAYYDKKLSYKHVELLSKHIDKLDSFQNALGALLFNGLFLYHVHAVINIEYWKKNFSAKVLIWLETIGHFEALCCFSNFTYNNPDYSFPKINNKLQIKFEEMGHPLINKNERISNSMDLSRKRFVILSGANMSGKSTFLRTLGVNFILAKVGAPVSCKSASIHPLSLLAAMRHSDSLTTGKSYFFAEVEKLEYIMKELDKGACFVLMDEILRGTNSEDKVYGTKQIIRKLMNKKTFGLIATHDLQVCELANDYIGEIVNMNFESQIVNNELVFDYKLREGICQSKSATFLLEKNNVI